jgi:hypothetical protein
MEGEKRGKHKQLWVNFIRCEISSSHGGEYDVQSCVEGEIYAFKYCTKALCSVDDGGKSN